LKLAFLASHGGSGMRAVLSAVQRGRVYTFDRDDWTRGRGPTALKLMIAQTIQSRFLQDAAPNGPFKYQP